jgi:hypothetical protein
VRDGCVNLAEHVYNHAARCVNVASRFFKLAVWLCKCADRVLKGADQVCNVACRGDNHPVTRNIVASRWCNVAGDAFNLSDRIFFHAFAVVRDADR